jgi:hypothetical protein
MYISEAWTCSLKDNLISFLEKKNNITHILYLYWRAQTTNVVWDDGVLVFTGCSSVNLALVVVKKVTSREVLALEKIYFSVFLSQKTAYCEVLVP